MWREGLALSSPLYGSGGDLSGSMKVGHLHPHLSWHKYLFTPFVVLSFSVVPKGPIGGQNLVLQFSVHP